MLVLDFLEITTKQKKNCRIILSKQIFLIKLWMNLEKWL